MTTDNCIRCGARVDYTGNYKIDLNLGVICDSCDFEDPAADQLADTAAVERLRDDLDQWGWFAA